MMFSVGDKVICIKNTPNVQEGWIGYVVDTCRTFDYNVQSTDKKETHPFREDELELLEHARKSECPVEEGDVFLFFNKEYCAVSVDGKEKSITAVSWPLKDGVIPVTWSFPFSSVEMVLFNIHEDQPKQEVKQEQYTGGSSDYYKIFIKNPTTLGEGYWAEANDIIEALGMDFAEGNAFKAIWRKARARQGVKKKGYDNGVYDSEKVVFFGERMLVKAKNEADKTTVS